MSEIRSQSRIYHPSTDRTGVVLTVNAATRKRPAEAVVLFDGRSYADYVSIPLSELVLDDDRGEK